MIKRPRAGNVTQNRLCGNQVDQYRRIICLTEISVICLDHKRKVLWRQVIGIRSLCTKNYVSRRDDANSRGDCRTAIHLAIQGHLTNVCIELTGFREPSPCKMCLGERRADLSFKVSIKWIHYREIRLLVQIVRCLYKSRQGPLLYIERSCVHTLDHAQTNPCCQNRHSDSTHHDTLFSDAGDYVALAICRSFRASAS